MGLRRYVVFMVILVFVASSCSGATSDEVWGHDKSDEAKVKTEEADGDAKDASESWTGLAMDKISENLGLKTEDAVGAGQYGYDKAGDVKNSAAEKAAQGKDKAQQVEELKKVEVLKKKRQTKQKHPLKRKEDAKEKKADKAKASTKKKKDARGKKCCRQARSN